MHEFKLPGYDRATTDKKKKEINRLFQSIFMTAEGKICLNILLSDLRFFRPCESVEDKALSEYAKVFLRERLGIENTSVITDAIISTLGEKE
jgi:hypothetical protein